MFKAGYLFKETHSDVHYVREDHGKAGDEYRENFTRDAAEAATFASQQEALDCVTGLMAHFERDDDYRWTPVALNLENGDITKVIDSRWH
jgi:hypothetical protein